VQAQRVAFDALAAGFRVRDIYLRVFQPSLYEIGRRWEQGQLSIPQEHLATAITQSVLSGIYAQVQLPTSLEKHAVVACLTNNYHEIGPRMLADFLQMAGYNAYFLGANTPEDSVLEMIQQLKPEVIGLPAVTPDHVQTVRYTVERIRSDFASYRPTVLVGGYAFNADDDLWKQVRADLWRPDAGQAVDELVGGASW
jgi:methanogenic corrinoid protein MtbC1